MKRIHLVRHGEQLRSVNDPGLSERGRKQAKATGLHLASITPEGVAGIYASTKRRAMETASIIRLTPELKDTPIIFDENLVEKKILMGDYDTFSAFEVDWKRSVRERDWKFPGGESARDTGMRMDQSLRSLPDHDLPYVVVAHSGIILDFLRNEFTTAEIEGFRPGFSKLETDSLQGFTHCSITTVTVEGQTYHLEDVEAKGHIERMGIGEGRPSAERK